MAALYLTQHEYPLFNALSEEIRGVWEHYLEEESTEGFEDDHMMKYRFGLLEVEDMPEVKELYGLVQSGVEAGDLSKVDFTSLSKKAMHVFFSCIGANGVTTFIELGLQRAVSVSDIEAIACLSRIRHGMLRSNLEFFTQHLA